MADRTIPAFKILRGSVGVGTTLPSSTFHVYSDSSTNTIINLQGGSATNKGAYMNFYRGTTNVGAFGTKASLIGGTSNDMMLYSASNDWIFYSTGERMRVQADGKVGIGTNAPAATLDVRSSDSVVAYIIRPSASPTVHIGSATSAGAQLGYVHASDYAFFGHDAVYNAIVVNSSGSVGIGTVAPPYPLSIKKGSSAIAFSEYSNGAVIWLDGANGDFAGGDYFQILADDAALRFGYAGITKVSMLLNGRFGVGTATPEDTLDVNGNAIVRGKIYFDGVSSSYIDNVSHEVEIRGANGVSLWSYYGAGWTERLTVADDGNVGIGTGTPVKKLDVRASESWDGIHIGSTAGSATAIDFARSTTHANPTARIGVAEPDATHTSDMRFYTSDATGSVPNLVEKMRIDPLGRVLIGVNGAMPLRWWNGTTYGAKLFVENNGSTAAADYVTAGVVRNTNDGEAPQLGFAKSRGTTTGAVTVVQSGDAIGTLTFQGADGTNYVEAARINAIVDGTPGADDMPGRLQFSTTADGTASPTVRMVIMSDGNVGIGTVSPAAHLHVSKGVGATTVLTQVAANSTVGYEIKKTGSTTQHWKIVDGQTANGYLEIYDATDSATRMAFNTDGNVGIGTVNAPHLLTLKGDGKYFAAYASDGSQSVLIGADSSGDGRILISEGAGGNKINFYAEAGAANYINNGGSVGIGTNNPTATLQVGTVTDSSTTAASLVHLASATASSTVNGFSTLKLDYKSGHAPSTVGAQIMFNQGYHSGNQDYTAPVGSVRGWKTGASDNYGGGLQFLYQPDSGSLGLLVGMTLEGSGHVGIGTNAPAYPLHVYYAGGAAIGMQVKGTANRAKLVVTDNDTSAYVIAEDSHASFGRQDALSASNLNINSNGSVGIGTNAASTFVKLNVQGAVRLGRGSNDLGSYDGDDFDLFVGYGANGSKIMLYDDQSAYHSALIQYGNSLFRIGLNNSNSAPTMRDDSAINIIPAGVGIGIGVFTARLAVKSAGSTPDQIVVVHSGNSVEIAQLGQSANGSSAGCMLLRNNSGTEKIYLDAAGSSYFRGGSITVGVDDTGHDVRLYGATSGRYWEWDESMDLVRMRDNVKTVFGNGDDLQIYHDGSNSYINETGTGGLVVKGSTLYFRNPSDQDMIYAASGAEVSLYYNNAQKFHTTSTGVKVLGIVNADTLNNAANSANIIYRSGSSTIVGNHASALVILDTGFVGIGTASTISSSAELLGVYSAGTGHASFKSSSDSTGTVYVRNVSTTANTWQPYLILADSGGNRGGLALKYSTAGLKVHGQGGVEFWTGASFGGGTAKMTILSGGNVGIGVASPTSLLHVTGDLGNSAFLAYFYNSGTQSEDNGLNVQIASSGSSAQAFKVNTGGDSNSFIVAGDGDVGVGFTPSSFAQKFNVNGNTYISGSVGIGDSSPERALDVDGRVLADTYGFRTDTALRYYYFDNYSGSNFMGRGGNAYTSLYDGGVLAMTWTAAKVGVSTTAAPKNLTVYFQSTDTSLAGEGLSGGSAGDGVLLYNNSTTTNAYANLDFRTGDSDGRIAYRRTGTNAGDFCFVTDNSGSPECKLYLYNLGGAKLYSSNSTASNIQFTIHNDKSDDSAVLALQAERTSLNDTGQIRFINKDNDIAAIRSYGGGGSSNQDGQLRFYTRQDSDGGVSERLRITEIGYSLFNCTSVPSSSVAGMAIYGSSSANMSSSGSSTSSYIHWNFFNGNGQVGYISTSGSTTTFSTSSDYRLKENLTPLTGALDRIGQLPVYRFNFKADKNTTVDGFLAHEVQSHVPEAVTGEKDAMKTVEIEAVLDDNGNELEPARTEEQPDYQGIDQSKLVPLLVAAIQELKAEVEALKNAK